jgi:ethanolamine utilization cobalamin adenosyltransferase
LSFAVPHKSLGEDIHAAVLLKEKVSEKELLAKTAFIPHSL